VTLLTLPQHVNNVTHCPKPLKTSTYEERSRGYPSLRSACVSMPASGSNPAGPGGQSVAIAKRCARIASVLGFAVINAPRSVSYFTFGRQKTCKPYLAKMGDENASHRMDRPRRPGRAWPALVGCGDVQIGPSAQRGNQLGIDAVRQSGFQLEPQ
jgi:hypothetical protein